MKLIIIALFGLMFAFSGAVLAQGNMGGGAEESTGGMTTDEPAISEASPEAGGEQAMTPTDLNKATAINRLHHINQKEIQMSQLGQEKAQSQQLKDLAGKILQDHQAAEKNIQELAKKENVQLQDFQASTYDKAEMENLKKLSGSQFDQAYLQSMSLDHKFAQQELQSVSKDIKDPEVKSTVDSLLPKIKQHGKMASGIKVSQPSRAGEAE